MEVSQIVLSILSSIITGGFVLVFVEIGNRKNRENDKYEHIMYPFMHKLSSYFRYISWCQSHIIYSNPPTSNEKKIKLLIGEIARYGGMAITSGGDYGINYFTASKLKEIALDINNIWYWHDNMNPCKMTWDSSMPDGEFISKELKEINPVYLQHEQNIDLIAKVSGDFYIYVYQPIEVNTYNHETYQKHYKLQTIIVSCFVCFVLLVLGSMLFGLENEMTLRISTMIAILMLVFSLLMLGVEENVQIRFYGWVRDLLKKVFCGSSKKRPHFYEKAKGKNKDVAVE